jgi:lipopolysaccharide transport protein LptA
VLHSNGNRSVRSKDRPAETKKATRVTAVATGLDPETGEWRLEGNVRMGADLGVIQADEAVGDLDFAGNEWRFTGNVRIIFGTAVLEADEARFAFQAHRLADGELTGTPAMFEDRAPQREDVVRGTANRLSYDAAAATLRLSGNVTIQVGPNEYSGCELLYDFGREAVTSGSTEDCEEPLHIRIQVPSGNAEPAPTPAP